MDSLKGIDLPGGGHQLAAPLAAYRSWVIVRGRNAAIELTATFERAPGAPMGDFHPDPDGSDKGFVDFQCMRRLRSPPPPLPQS
jgi:hypothetical protein